MTSSTQSSSSLSTFSSTASTFTDHFANPLYISPGDSLSAPIVGVKLTNENYHVWSQSMSVALSIKNKLSFIDGSYPALAATDPSYSAWIRCNFAVLNWMLNSVSEDIAQSLISYDNATTAWNDLKHRFSQCDAIRIADLQSLIASCNQGEANITQYFTNMKVLWEEYLQYRPIPLCDCNPGHVVDCKVVSQMLLYQDQDYAIRFIRGLNDNFDVVRSQLLLMNPLPDINIAFKFAVQLERQMKGTTLRSMDSIALAAPSYHGKGKRVDVQKLFCRSR